MCIPVHQYSLDGEYIASFPSIIEVEYQLGIPNESVWKAVNHKLKQTHNFRWSTEKVERLNEEYKSRNRKINQFDLNGNFIQSFNSIRAAALFCNKTTGSSNIYRLLLRVKEKLLMVINGHLQIIKEVINLA